jgi:alkyl hydroperoxide reductase subunit AhpC
MAPDFTAVTTHGQIDFHDWIGDAWCVLFSHPKDFTPVCTTELGAMARLMPEFSKRGVKVIGFSVDAVETHEAWLCDIEETQQATVSYPLIADPELKVAKLYGMLAADASHDGPRTAADNHTVRSVFVIAPDKTIKLMITYPMTTGRDFAEILRVIDSLQLTAKHKVATPANWRKGDAVIIVPSVTDEEARKAFPVGWIAPKPYMRFVTQPT